jgi:hypothetical protein
MQKVPKFLIGLAVLAGIVAIGILIGRLGGSGNKNQPVAETPNTAESASTRPSPNPPATHTTTEPRTKPVPQIAATAESNPASASVITNWEEKVDEILRAETDETNKVIQLFELFPRVPSDAKAEIAQHLSNLTSDANYPPLGELLKDPQLPEPALDVLMADVLNRPNSVKLPELLAVARTADHPKAQEAKEILGLFLDEDFGSDWNKWQEKMVAWLKDNPD